MDGKGDYNWAYRLGVFSGAERQLRDLGDYESAAVMERMAERESEARTRWRPRETPKFATMQVD